MRTPTTINDVLEWVPDVLAGIFLGGLLGLVVIAYLVLPVNTGW